MIELLPHQQKAVDQLSNGKVLWGGVGSGKTFTALAYYVKKESPRHIYVITTARKRDELDWEGEAAKLGIGMIAGATCHGVINVDSWNNISKYTDVEDAFFIFDEQRVVGNGVWVKSFLKIAKKNHWILLSATPGDTWIDYVPVFIANNLYKNITEFKREHVVYAPYTAFPIIARFLNERTLEKYRNMILVEMPYMKHTKRHLEWIQTRHDKDAYDLIMKSRWNPFTEEPIKDAGEMARTLRRVVNSDPSRVAELRSLAKKHDRLIVFYNYNYELDILRELKYEFEDVEVAEWNGHKKEPVPSSKKWIYLVQYVAGAEAWNCTETDAMVFYSMTYSYKNFEQAQGRIDRLNTKFTDLYYYIFLSFSNIDLSVRESLTDKKVFNESAWVEKTLGKSWKFENHEPFDYSTL